MVYGHKIFIYCGAAKEILQVFPERRKNTSCLQWGGGNFGTTLLSQETMPSRTGPGHAQRMLQASRAFLGRETSRATGRSQLSTDVLGSLVFLQDKT